MDAPNPARTPRPPRPKFMAELEGLRALAALGVCLTHISFQTGLSPASPLGAVLSRLDLCVPIFFALSAFVLWRRYGFGARPQWVRAYYWSRLWRLVPALLVYVLAVAVLLPAGYHTPPRTLLATVLLVQIYLPFGLAPGLTHLWSLSIECAYYIALPALVFLAARLRPRRGWWLGAGLLLVLGSWAYPFLPAISSPLTPGAVNPQLFPPAYVAWFAVGMVAAEWENWRNRPAAAARKPATAPLGARAGQLVRIMCAASLVLLLWVAAQPWFGPQGLTHPTAAQFLLRNLAGTAVAALALWPLVAWPYRRSVLASAPLQWLGKISYSFFLWHLLVLELALPLIGMPVFGGRTLLVTAVVVPASVVVAAASEAWVERPFRDWAGQRI